MHHTKLNSGNHVNHNGGWDGDLNFGTPPTLADIAQVLSIAAAREIGAVTEDMDLTISSERGRARRTAEALGLARQLGWLADRLALTGDMRKALWGNEA